MRKVSIRKLLERILDHLVSYIDNWQPRYVDDSTDTVRENIIKAHTFLSTLANKSDKRVKDQLCCIENELCFFDVFYETSRVSDELLSGSKKICELAQKCVKVISSIPDKTDKTGPPYYWTKRIIISVIVLFVMFAIIIPNLKSPKTEQDEQLPSYEATQSEDAQVSNTTPEPTSATTTSQGASEPKASTPPVSFDARTVLSGETNGIKWEYRGYINNELPHGYGKQEFSNGSWFDGEWHNGQFLTGKGMYICESGDWFLGDFVDGYWASGVLYMRPSGAKYKGDFIHRDGIHYRHGTGRMEWPNGDWYEGGWSYDNRHGQGVAFHAATRTHQSGVWINNVLQ